MNTLVLAPACVLGLTFALIVPVLWKLFRGCKADDVTAEWLESFSVASYYAMEGLLSDEDFNFLSRQPGFDLSLFKKLRRERLSIFKQYLNRSIRDFNRLYVVVLAMLPHATSDCSDLASRLIWLRLRFSLSVLRAEFSYRLCLLGFRTLAVRSLIAHLEEMSSQIGVVAAAQGA